MGGGSTGVIVGVAVAVVAIIVISLVSTSLKKIETHEVGLKYDTVWRKLGDEPVDEGLHTGPPGFKFLKFPSVFTTLSFESLRCLNKDGVPIMLDVTYQYKAQAGQLKEIVELFRDKETYEEVLTFAGVSAIHEACSRYNTSQFQAERGSFQVTVSDNLAIKYAGLWADVSEIQVSNIARPSAYESAIQAKESARENIKVIRKERPRKLTEAETRRHQATTQAEITIAQAQSQARIIRTRAESTSTAILNEYSTEAATYEDLRSVSGLDLNDEGFLSYVGIRTISNAKNPVYIAMKSPAKTSYVQP